MLCSRVFIEVILTIDRRQNGRNKARAGLRKKNKDNKNAVSSIKHYVAEQSKERLADSLKGDNQCVRWFDLPFDDGWGRHQSLHASGRRCRMTVVGTRVCHSSKYHSYPSNIKPLFTGKSLRTSTKFRLVPVSLSIDRRAFAARVIRQRCREGYIRCVHVTGRLFKASSSLIASMKDDDGYRSPPDVLRRLRNTPAGQIPTV